jgi:ubiquitin C-terminal hydrolase
MHLFKKLIRITLLFFWIISCQNTRSPNLVQVAKQPSLGASDLVSPGGIPNLGATCYMNAVLQILKAFYLPKINEKDDILGKAFQVLMQTIQADKNIATQEQASACFEALLNQFKSWLESTNKQEDAGELLIHIFDWMKLPTAQMNYTLVHPATHEIEAENSVPWLIHMVSLCSLNKPLTTMQEYFANSLEADEIVRNNSKLSQAKRLSALDKLYNDMLVLQLTRYTFNEGISRKNKEEVQAPFHLTIKKEQTVNMDKDWNYNLAGFIYHVGDNLNGGHYIPYIRKEGRWICYDDDHVYVLSDTDAEDKAKKSYLFFYQLT